MPTLLRPGALVPISGVSPRNAPQLEVFDAGVKGMGLRSTCSIRKGVEVARMDGTFVTTLPPPGAESFHVKHGVWLVLGHASRRYAGNLVNTAGEGEKNNCRYVYQAGRRYVRLLTVRCVEAGGELLVPYGSKYTSKIRRQAYSL